MLGVGGGRTEGSRQEEEVVASGRRAEEEGGWVTNPSPSTRPPLVHTLSLCLGIRDGWN